MAKYSRKTHLEMARCLRAAKEKLDPNTLRFVCYAVDGTDFSSDTKRKVKGWIMKQIGTGAFVTGWLREAHQIDPFNGISAKARIEYRKAWIDHMVNILES